MGEDAGDRRQTNGSQLIELRALDHAVEMSGGVVRELVRIIQGSASRALVAKANVIKFEHVEQAVDELRNGVQLTA